VEKCAGNSTFMACEHDIWKIIRCIFTEFTPTIHYEMEVNTSYLGVTVESNVLGTALCGRGLALVICHRVREFLVLYVSCPVLLPRCL